MQVVVGAGDVVGWDIGGAHLKAARIANGIIRDVVQVPCKLWMGLDQLDGAFAEILARIGPCDRHRVTMTGELVDLFPDRRTGALALTERAVAHLRSVSVYAGRAGFVSPADVGAHVIDIASANWHATASLVAPEGGDGVMIDMGSTTTDIIPYKNGQLVNRGYTDSERLTTGELIYTGAVRTPLMTFPDLFPFQGRLIAPMAEYFATMADVHRLTGRLPEEADLHDAADGGPKTIEASRRRLARMIGMDVSEATESEWLHLAWIYVERQLRRVHDGAMLALSGLHFMDDSPIIACGVGRFVIEALSWRLGRVYIDLADLMPVGDAPGHGDRARAASNAAAAVAVALLP